MPTVTLFVPLAKFLLVWEETGAGRAVVVPMIAKGRPDDLKRMIEGAPGLVGLVRWDCDRQAYLVDRMEGMRAFANWLSLRGYELRAVRRRDDHV